MAALRQVVSFKVTSISHQILRNFHLNPIVCNAKWRQQRKMTVNPNAFGPLTNLPDYSFKDGRPVPYGSHQKRRIDEQRNHLIRIKALVSEIDYAVIKHEARLKAAEEEKQSILDRKLNEKGRKLLLHGSEALKLLDDESKEKDSKLVADVSKK